MTGAAAGKGLTEAGATARKRNRATMSEREQAARKAGTDLEANGNRRASREQSREDSAPNELQAQRRRLAKSSVELQRRADRQPPFAGARC